MPVSPRETENSELIERWRSYLEVDVGRASQTAIKYGQYLTRLANWLTKPPAESQLAPTGRRTLLTVTFEDLRIFTGLWAHKQGLSAAARRPLVSAVKNFYAWCTRHKLIELDPALLIDSPKAGRKLPRAASLDWTEKLLQAPDIATFRGLRDALILTLLAGCGMRVSGVTNLNESSAIWTKEGGRDRLSLRITEKGSKERQVPVPDEAAMLLRAYLGHPELKAVDRSLPSGDAVLIISTMANGTHAPHEWHGEARRISRRTVLDMMQRYAERAGIDPSLAHPHSLRHLYGTELAEANVDLIERGALLGHADPRTTEVYTRLAQRKLRTSVDKANPLGKMRAPLLDSLRALSLAAANGAKDASVPLDVARNPRCG